MSKLLRGSGSSSSDSDVYSDHSLDEKKSAWYSTWTYIYNPQKKTCCTRTPKQWLIMVIYYLAYTIFLVCLFLVFLYGCSIVIKLISDDFPLVDKTYLIDNAFPGLGVIPSKVHSKFPIIWYSPDPAEEITEKEYIDDLDKFFAQYKQADRAKYANCESKNDGSKPCYFDLNRLGDCNESGYQYTNSSLCFFLKLNRLRNWTPVYYQTKRELANVNNVDEIHDVIASSKQNVIYVHCFGRNFWDKEHLGNITYYPQQGFNGYYFPYKGQPDYLSPLVGIKLDNVTTGVMIRIGCKLWSKNINPRLNNVYLNIFVDNTLPY